jgi:hypothetical protein
MMRALTLLCGMPRSGTTWIGKIFDSHPDTLYRHEPDSDSAGIKSIPLVALPSDAERYREVLRTFIEGLPHLKTARSAGSLPLFPKRYCSLAQLKFKKLAVLLTKASSRIPIVDFVDYQQVRNLHVVWKSIESLGRVGVIARAVPECRTIIILRHPCGYIASVLNGEDGNRFSAAIASGDDFPVFEMLLRQSSHKERNPSLEEIKTLPMEERLAWRWVLYNEIARTGISSLDRCLSVRYEDLCSDPLSKARELLSFAGLDWDRQVETFIHRSTTRSSSRYYSVYKDPLDSAMKWQQQLTPLSVERILRVVSRSDLAEIYLKSCAAQTRAPASASSISMADTNQTACP